MDAETSKRNGDGGGDEDEDGDKDEAKTMAKTRAATTTKTKTKLKPTSFDIRAPTGLRTAFRPQQAGSAGG